MEKLVISMFENRLGMNVQIHKAEREDKAVLRQLLEFYCYDFSEYLQTDVNIHGKFEYRYLDSYWIEKDRTPYFIKVKGAYAGFVLVNKDFKIIDDPNGHIISEFFIMRKYRGKGIGINAAKQVFELHPGEWEISTVMINKVALKFWQKVVDEYSQGHYKKEKLENTSLKKQILIFKNYK